MDVPVLLNEDQMRNFQLSEETITESHNKNAGRCHCRCFSCGWSFCGICRSPSHPGSACFDDSERVVRLAKRRPPLASELQDMAARVAEEVKLSKAEEAKQLANAMQGGDFENIRQLFLDAHEQAIWKGLTGVLGNVNVYPAPVSKHVKARFMASYRQNPGIEVRPAFHGTDARNHDSIFEKGLLIPGEHNDVRMVHGAAHGQGVYTANIDAAWLSRGFCSHPVMLVCGVLQTSSVRHVYDAMVVSDSSHVVPLFVGDASSPSCKASLKLVAAPVPTTGGARNSKSSKGKSVTDTAVDKKSDKTSKFIARLSRKSNRH